MTTQKIALVIGGSGGIGSAVVRRLLANGFFVCATYAHNGQKVETLRRKFEGKPVTFYQMDLLDENETKSTMEQIVKDHPRIDVVVFAPSPPLTPIHLLEADWDEFETHHRVQVRGMWQVVNSLKIQIKAGNGIKFIVLLTEACVGKPPSRLASYVTAKYGLLGFAKVMAVELAPYHCTVNCVSPGMVETNLIQSFPSKMVEMTAAQNPLKRIATPEDVAGVVSFLASDEAGYLNGVNVTVNGGEIML